MTDAAPPDADAPRKPRALWPWVLGMVLLLLGTLAFSFWWPMHRAGRLIRLVEEAGGEFDGMEKTHPAWLDWLFGEEVFHPWFDRITQIDLRWSESVDDRLLTELTRCDTLRFLNLDISHVSPAAILELNRLPALEGFLLRSSESANSLEWMAEMTVPRIRFELSFRDMSPRDWESIGKCKGLESLVLSSCRFGEIPEIQLPDKLTSVEISGCHLSGTLGRVLSRGPNLESMSCGSCTSEIEFWVAIRETKAGLGASIIDFPLTEANVNAINEVRSLNSFTVILRNAKLESAEIARLGRLRALYFLEITNSDLPDDGSWEALSQLTQLRVVNLSDSTVGDRAATALAKTHSIDAVFFSGTSLTDVGLQALAQNQNIGILGAERTNVTPAQVEMLKRQRPYLMISTSRD